MPDLKSMRIPGQLAFVPVTTTAAPSGAKVSVESLCAFISVSGDGHSTVSPAPDASPHAATAANVKVLRFSIITSPLQLNH